MYFVSDHHGVKKKQHKTPETIYFRHVRNKIIIILSFRHVRKLILEIGIIQAQLVLSNQKIAKY